MNPYQSLVCPGCSAKRKCRLFPLRCSCGAVMYADGTYDLPRFGLGDAVAYAIAKVGIKKRAGCGCDKRQRRLNNLHWRAERLVKIAATWLHPR